MAKSIDFSRFGIYTDISKSERREFDVRKEFADMLYTKVSGIAAHDLAFRIYRSGGRIELSDEEVSLIVNVSGQYCSGAFCDSLAAAMDDDVEQ